MITIVPSFTLTFRQAKQVFWLPNIVFGVISIVTGLTTLFLPETRGKALPLTTKDVRRILYAKAGSNDKTADCKDQGTELLENSNNKQ